ncbi:hypothetical protein [Nocardia coubleae]|uniref:Uncharacterized protein n=1 Tax=Nocardia coubleae TaxID=356147 RepID=A0A846WEZ7_9NOCA|nr:hypothetical protein [Nocardia coubleae]NKX91204.1 hypothetical protein [Nocardia coubleae]
MAGDVPAAQPASRRIAEKVWHMPFESLIAVPQPMMEGLQPDITESLDQEIAMSTDESAQWIKRSTTGVDPVVLDQLRFEVGQHAVDYLVKPPITLIPELNRTRREVFQLLDAPRQRPRTAATLYLLAGQVCALLAHACADLGRTSAAETHARTAQLAADFAEDQHLRAYVSWIQANVAYWNNDFGQAVYFAENGLAKSSDLSTRLRLASQLARAQAARGNTAAAMAALDLALDLAPNVHPNASEPGVMHFDPAKALYYGSEVHLAIGGRTHNTLALELAENALDLLADSSPAEFRAAAELDAARAHLALGDADAAHYRITRVLDLPVELRTTPIVGRVVSAGTELHALAAQTSTARDMTQQIELFTTYTAERD